MKEFFREVAEKIGRLEKERERLAKAIRSIGNIKFKIGNLTNDSIINKVNRVKVSGKVCGIDGGLQKRSFHGVDIIVVRSCGVCISYEGSKIKEVKYYLGNPRIYEEETTSDAELVLLSSMYRMIDEAEKAIEVAKENPDYILLDGPVYPHPSIQTAKNEYASLYRKIIKLYSKLLENPNVIGIVEDSRSKYFSKILKNDIVPLLPKELKARFPKNIHEFRDTSLLLGALSEGERTFVFKINGIRDVSYKDKIFAFYLKTARYDRPVRVEFVSDAPGKHVNKIASLVFSLSSFSTYGIPSVLIEADARAHLPEKYMDYIERMILTPSPLLMKLRREDRPI